MKKAIYLLLIIFVSLSAPASQPEAYIITHPESRIVSLKSKEIKDIFTGKKTLWNGNHKIILATLKDSETHREFLRRYVRKTPSQFRNFWRRKVFTGEGHAPKIFDDEASLTAFVADTKGAVGYVGAPPGNKVQVITISDEKGGQE